MSTGNLQGVQLTRNSAYTFRDGQGRPGRGFSGERVVFLLITATARSFNIKELEGGVFGTERCSVLTLSAAFWGFG